MKVPISLRIFLLLLLNLSLVLGVIWWVSTKKYDLEWDEIVQGNAEDRVSAMSQLLYASLEPLARNDWTPVLKEYEEGYRVSLGIYRPHGEELMEGSEWEVSELEKTLFRGPGEGGRRPPRERYFFEELVPDHRGWPEAPKSEPEFLDIVTLPSGHVAGVRMKLQEDPDERERSIILLVREEEGSSLFFTWKPVVWAVIAAGILTLLVWVPWIYRVTRRLGILTKGAESIAEGDFEVEVATSRLDEIGQLSRSLQKMAGKLDDLVSGQKRFLGDIAHELCSPLVRIRMGLGVLENQLNEDDRKKLETVGGEVEELSQLVNELLDFSKASIQPKSLAVTEINLEAFCSEVISREGAGEDIQLSIPGSLKLVTNEDLLRRALSNVVRNAVRYAKEIEIVVRERNGMIELEVSDRGPGISDDWLEHIFEPFTRPDIARTREAGGAGLGLAITKTCIESLKGRITASNRSEGGLSVLLKLPPS